MRLTAEMGFFYKSCNIRAITFVKPFKTNNEKVFHYKNFHFLPRAARFHFSIFIYCHKKSRSNLHGC